MITNQEIGYNGRLGNQMFQYAVLLNLASRLNTDVVLPLKNNDIKPDGCFDYSVNNWIPYKLDLYDCFNITAVQSNNIDIKHVYKEPHFNYSNTINSVIDNTSVQGYFQSDKYFTNSKEKVLSEFVFKDTIEIEANSFINDIKSNVDGREIVGIHVRRGDAVVNPTFHLLNVEYFVSCITKYFTDTEYAFVFISDDIQWCKNTFDSADNVFFTGRSSFVDLSIMSKCDHNIISNSSYSWWGVYLNKNKNKKIVSPSKWFKSESIIMKDLYCKDWIIE